METEETPGGRRRKWLGAAGLVAAGGIAGAITAATMSAGAATSPSPSPSTGGSIPGYAPGHGDCHRGGMHALAQTGTVTAVGSNSVTIRTSSGTHTYGVTNNSDIDKNGEAKLSDLKV